MSGWLAGTHAENIHFLHVKFTNAVKMIILMHVSKTPTQASVCRCDGPSPERQCRFTDFVAFFFLSLAHAMLTPNAKSTRLCYN